MNKLINYLNNNQKFYISIFFVILLHLIFINWNSVNFEYVFVEGSKFIDSNFDKSIVENFFLQQANTFFFTFLVSCFAYIFPFFDSLYIGKFISLLSYIFLGLGVMNIFKTSKSEKNNNIHNIVYVLLVLNPMIWIFGYRSTPDLISSSIAFYAFSLFYKNLNLNLNLNIKTLYISVVLIGFATAIKPIVGIYFVMILILMPIEWIIENIYIFFKICFFYSIIPSIYFILVYKNFNFFLFSPFYQEVLRPNQDFIKYISNWVLYFSFLFIFLLPILSGRIFSFLIKLNFKHKILFSVASLVFYVLGSRYLISSVEMNFGIISKYFNPNILNGFLSILCFFFILILISEIKKNYQYKNLQKNKILYISILYIFIISITLASQRYLIVIIPIFYYIFSEYHRDKLNYLFIIFICIPLNITLLGNQYLTSSLSHEMIKNIEKKFSLDDVCSGAISSHIANYFTIEDRKSENCYLKKYHIVNGKNINSIYSVSEKFLFLNKSYSLIKVR